MGWVPPTNVFPDQPPANTVYMTESPPPYPGITGYAPGAGPAPNGAAAVGAGGWPGPWGPRLGLPEKQRAGWGGTMCDDPALRRGGMGFNGRPPENQRRGWGGTMSEDPARLRGGMGFMNLWGDGLWGTI